MNNPRSLLRSAARLVFAMLALMSPAAAQDYPTRPVRLVIPFPPGGSNDVVGRLVATHLAERLGKQVVVDNRAGAGGVIGTEVVAKSPADGYTLLVISMAHAVNPWLYKLTYDPIKDFAPVGLLAKGANVLVVHPSLPVNSVKELVALAKQKPGDLQYASAGIGSFQHLGGELFKLMAGVDILHVPFKGGGPAMVDIVGGHTKVGFFSMVQTVPQIKAGKLRALGTGALERSPALPDVPTIAEAGVPGYEAVNWWGIVAPAGTPPAIIDKVNREIEAVQQSPEVQKQFDNEGATPVSMKPADFGAYMVSEMNKWERVVKQGGIKAE
ncbi:MAG TPA: tripartite tricarboxylate transporter substrate binding protein [Xanthobacteraceae bacterium]|jgi:tripartite-type tricarboxylate transporter receptor subunit TctC|nr:tripartite tricarboxylate transporter substrate binding protein [Xanthobacteraceae bacterium]